MIADGGRIVNMSSGLARFAIPGYSAYGVLKGQGSEGVPRGVVLPCGLSRRVEIIPRTSAISGRLRKYKL